MGAFRPHTEVAVYGAASRLVILVAMPLVIVNSVVPPLIAGM
jgi:O-antigen/teichoic acid export membrane protein